MDSGFTIQGAVTQVLRDLGQSAVHYAPRLVTAVILVLIALALAKVLALVVGQVLHRAKVESVLERIGLMDGLQRIGIQDVSRGLVPPLLFWLVMLIFIQSAAEMVGLVQIAAGITAFFAFLPNLLSAALILLLGNALGQFASRAVTTYARDSGIGFARSLGNSLAAFVLFVAVIIALGQLQVDTRILNILTVVIFSGAALAFGLTFGLGTRDTTRNLIAGFYARRHFSAGQDVELAGARGRLRAISATQTLLEDEGSTIAVPNTTFLDQVVRRRETPSS